MKLNDILAKRIGPWSLGGWLGICVAIVAAGVIRSYVWPEKTNDRYLRELIETGTVQKTATAYVASIKNATAAPGLTAADWVQIEKGLSECLVKQANIFLASGDPYLRVKADKTTPVVLAKRFLDACDGTGPIAPGSSSFNPKDDDSQGVKRSGKSLYDALELAPMQAPREGSGMSESIQIEKPRGIPAPSSDDLKAAAAGDPAAQYGAGLRFSLRASLEDYKEAVFWFEKAATQGHAPAQYELGALYYRGQGVPKDHKQAAFWFQKAAESGDQAGQYDVGLMYYRGEGVTQDYVEAHKWWNLAGSSGDQKARDRREIVEQKMTREQIAEAQRRASVWMKAHK